MTAERVLVTGATGFIGGRLVEKLVLERGVRVHALVRDLTRAARIARFEVEMVHGDVTDPTALSTALQGCGTVFHCAHDGDAHDGNVAAARELVAACADAGVGRLVYVSSAAVYEPLTDGPLTEDRRQTPNGWWAYRDSKIRAEDALLSAGFAEPAVVIVQPTIVYGPFGSFWTAGPIHWLRRGRIALPGDRDGLCNAVYVDDVVDALLLAAESDTAVGERILVSAAQPVPWKDYFGGFEGALGVRSLVFMPHERLRRLAALPPRTRVSIRTARAFLREPIRATWTAPLEALQVLPVPIPVPVERRIREISSPWRTWFPDEEQLALFSARTTVNIDKARRVLGFEPRFDFDRGMGFLRAYIEWARL